MATGNKMRPTALIVGILLTLFAPFGADARDAYASWDNRCEECHGDADEFARKYLWVVGDQLQGRHHVDDLRLFMRNHYIPAHEIDKMHAMLRKQANDLGRFAVECGGCHNGAEDFVRASISSWGGELTGVESGAPVTEFLQSHQGLASDDAEFFTRLLARVQSQIARK
jgi:hypothetical protein